MNESLIWWLIRYPAGLAGPMTVLAGGGNNPFTFVERTVKAIQNPVELDAHLIGEGPAGNVIGGNRRSARVSEIVGMVLRLEHIHHVGTERLRRLDHQRIGGR